jgi:hypothetical protein
MQFSFFTTPGRRYHEEIFRIKAIDADGRSRTEGHTDSTEVALFPVNVSPFPFAFSLDFNRFPGTGSKAGEAQHTFLFFHRSAIRYGNFPLSKIGIYSLSKLQEVFFIELGSNEYTL